MINKFYTRVVVGASNVKLKNKKKKLKNIWNGRFEFISIFRH